METPGQTSCIPGSKVRGEEGGRGGGRRSTGQLDSPLGSKYTKLSEPSQFPEVMGRLSSCRKCAYLSIPSQFPPPPFLKVHLGFEQEADFPDTL